ncbi:MAG: GTPase Era [Fimbriimonadaceae bacterium]
MAFRAGTVAIVGKPNVGKSTLLNRIVGQKVSIVSNKPQTTRRAIMGIARTDAYEIAFIDTPGVHIPHTVLGKAMLRQAETALSDVDAILVVVDGSQRPDELEQRIASMIAPEIRGAAEVIVCLNKMDKLKPEHVIERTEAYTDLFRSDQYMLTTATDGTNVDKLVAMIVAALPEGDPRYPEDEFTDQSSRFMVSEIIRERVLVSTREEVPHATAVYIDDWDESRPELLQIRATILVEKPGQKAIIIGRAGQNIKKLGTEARTEIEELLGRHIFLDLHVRVREEWRMNRRIVQELESDSG